MVLEAVSTLHVFRFKIQENRSYRVWGSIQNKKGMEKLTGERSSKTGQGNHNADTELLKLVVVLSVKLYPIDLNVLFRMSQSIYKAFLGKGHFLTSSGLSWSVCLLGKQIS